MRISIQHPSLGPQSTRLSAEVAISATSSTVENNTGFGTNDYVVFGNLGEETTEIVLLTSASGTTTLGHTTGPTFAHSARTKVSEIAYNQVKIYRATSESGSYSLVTTMDLAVDKSTTVYDDADGDADSWYKVKYYNETTAVLSGFSAAIQGSGYTEDSLGSMTDEISGDFNDPDGKELTRDQIYKYLRAGVRKITMELIKTFPDYRKNYTALTLSSGTASLPTRFLSLFRVDAGETVDTAYKAEYVNENQLYSGTTYSEYAPKVYIRGSSIYIEPDTISYAYVWYYDYPADMTLENSEHGLPYGARDVLVAYAFYRAWLGKDADKSTSFKSLYKELLNEYIDFVAQSRQIINSRMVDIVYGKDLYEDV